MTSPISIPGDGSSWPEAAREWLGVLGCSTAETESVMQTAVPFAPDTLKQILTAVMDLGRRAGRLGEVMALLGHLEVQFRQLRGRIDIPRAAPPERLVPVAVLVLTPAGWVAPGGWVPDVLDRAAGRDVLARAGESPKAVSPEAAVDAGAEHLFVTGREASLPDIDRIQTASGLAFERIHIIKKPSNWLSPGPSVSDAVFEAASCMHGFSAVFSPRSPS